MAQVQNDDRRKVQFGWKVRLAQVVIGFLLLLVLLFSLMNMYGPFSW